MTEKILVNKLTKYYGSFKAVSNVSFKVNEGEVFGLIGPNGAGKSTTMRSMLNFIFPTSGNITINGTPAEGDICYFRIFRDTDDGNDDMAEDARLIGIKLFFTTDAANDA